MTRTSKKLLPVFLLTILASAVFSSCGGSGAKYSNPISPDWKFKLGDNAQYSAKDYDDSSWRTMDGTGLKLDQSHYAWLRQTVSVPRQIDINHAWFGFEKTNCAAEVYVNGVYTGKHGSLPPAVNVRTEKTSAVIIPSSCIGEDRTVTIALRLYGPNDAINDLSFYMFNEAMADSENYTHNITNQRVFLILAFLSIFIMIYSFANWLSNRKDLTYLYFSLCLMAISFYFLDLGAESLILPYTLHRALVRPCLPVSMTFLMLFMNRFFHRTRHRQLLIAALSVDAVCFTVYLIFIGNNTMTDTLFTVLLSVVVATLVYGFTASIKGMKKKVPYALNVFLSMAIGTIFALRDVVYMVLGKTPYMWTQGIAVFLLDLLIFIVLCLRSAQTQKQVINLAHETEGQKNKLEEVFSSAKNMAKETALISEQLMSSVDAVANAAKDSKEMVLVINKAVEHQPLIRNETSAAVDNLTQALSKLNMQFDQTSESIRNTAQDTQEVMDGIQAVGEGISTAAGFTNSLSSLTQSGSEDMQKLSAVMDKIQHSSKEILGVVTTLDDFAQQTDLLSMNASIEAAHSGEAGKGFAVIAHEIKNLAAQTSTWSTKIGEIITSVIKEIENSVALTNKVHATLNQIQQGAGQSAEKVTLAAESMKVQQTAGRSIAQESTLMAQSAKSMKDEVASQSTFSEHVHGNMEELTKASASVNQASQDISETSSRLSEQVEALTALAQRAKDTAEGLERLMKI